MTTLHLSEQGGRLRLRSGRLVLESSEGAVVLDVPARKVRSLVVHGRVGLTTPALVFLLQNGADVSFVSCNGRYYGQASSAPCPSPERIERQLRVYNSDFGIYLAKSIVRGKMYSQAECLRRKGLRSDVLAPLRSALASLERMDDLEGVRGVEGLGSRHYFAELGRLHPELGFSHRLRRPPRDPVNAALSYAYAMLLAIATSVVASARLHPEIGVLHTTSRRKPSLALDLMEEFRVPLVDIPVFSGFARDKLNRRDALVSGNGVRLGEGLKRELIRLFEERLHSPSPEKPLTYRELLFKQAERLASAIVHERPYRPFTLPRS